MGLDNRIGMAMYFSSILTDHKAMALSIMVGQPPRGKGYWKFNDMLLQNKEYVTSMNTLLDNKLQEYQDMEPKRKWELLKFGIANHTQNWARDHANEKKLIIAQLYEKVNELEKCINQLPEDDPSQSQKQDLLDRSKADLEELEMEHTRGIMF